MSRISKIKRNSEGFITIVEVERSGEMNESETVHKIYDKPHPDLPLALAALEQHVRTILEWPKDYGKDHVSITGVSYSYSENSEVHGATITGLLDLSTADSPFSWNTPHLPFDQYSDGGVAKLMPDEAIDALELLRTEARKFLTGEKRAQDDLFSSSTSNANEGVHA